MESTKFNTVTNPDGTPILFRNKTYTPHMHSEIHTDFFVIGDTVYFWGMQTIFLQQTENETTIIESHAYKNYAVEVPFDIKKKICLSGWFKNDENSCKKFIEETFNTDYASACELPAIYLYE